MLDSRMVLVNTKVLWGKDFVFFWLKRGILRVYDAFNTFWNSFFRKFFYLINVFFVVIEFYSFFSSIYSLFNFLVVSQLFMIYYLYHWVCLFNRFLICKVLGGEVLFVFNSSSTANPLTLHKRFLDMNMSLWYWLTSWPWRYEPFWLPHYSLSWRWTLNIAR